MTYCISLTNFVALGAIFSHILRFSAFFKHFHLNFVSASEQNMGNFQMLEISILPSSIYGSSILTNI